MSTLSFTATVTGPPGANPPTASGNWSISGVTGITTCATTDGPTATSNVSTYHCTVVASLAGTYGANFTFPGDSGYLPVSVAASATTTVVSPATPTISVASSGGTTLASTLTFTATVTGKVNSVAPTGNVTWTSSGTGGATTCAPASNANPSGITSTYTCAIVTAQAGTYIATAAFAGDANYNAVTSSTSTFTLAQQTPTITLSASTPTLSGHTTLTTTIVGVPNAIQPSHTPTWSITDPNNQALTCTIQGSPTVVSTNVTTYTCTFPTNTPGTYTITGTEAADTNYVAVTSAPITQTLGQNTPTIYVSVTPGLTTTVGVPITFVATITGNGVVVPTGSVTWKITGGAASSCNTNTNPSSAPGTIAYGCVINPAVSGTYTAQVTFNGDNNYSSLPITDPTSATTGQKIRLYNQKHNHSRVKHMEKDKHDNIS